ncbi:hypothetical protein A3K63_01370 [Candidatus Micrarchaeota archaeon RBG_16_49_10]|nr:MAG: hypothetical protein A3K63_01370 [Candidatus Micrarchaeota archaeon RBG_16_49_10]
MGEILTSLFVLGLVALLMIILYQNFTEFHTIVNEYGVQRHTIALANVLLTSSDIVYTEDGMQKRAMFDYNKMGLLSKGEFFDKYSYPDAFYIIIVRDLETEENWYTVKNGPMSFEHQNVVQYFKCLGSQLTEAVEIPSIQDLNECIKEDFSSSGGARLSFPVGIRNGDDIHMGTMEIISGEF